MEVLNREESAVAEYRPFYAQLAELEQKNAALAFDYESLKGNKEARSHINTLRLTKGALERTRKSAKEESLRIGRAIDAEAKEINGRIEAMITVHQDAVDAIEQREKDRVATLATRLHALKTMGANGTAAHDLSAAIDFLEPLVIGDDWQEFKPQALEAKDQVLRDLRQRHGEAVEQEAKEAELARLRAEAAERERLEHEAAIVRAAEERARAEAARVAQEAEARAAAEREAAARRELELKLAAESAERRRVEAEQRAEQERIDYAANVKRQAEEAEAAAARRAAKRIRSTRPRSTAPRWPRSSPAACRKSAPSSASPSSRPARCRPSPSLTDRSRHDRNHPDPRAPPHVPQADQARCPVAEHGAHGALGNGSGAPADPARRAGRGRGRPALPPGAADAAPARGGGLVMLRFIVHQYRQSCRAGFGRRKSITRAVRTYVHGF